MVAIKTIRLEGLAAAGASLDELMDRFKREAQVSAQLKHPNIVTIYDIGEADGHRATSPWSSSTASASTA